MDDDPFDSGQKLFHRKLHERDGFLLNDIAKPIKVDVINSKRSARNLRACMKDNTLPTNTIYEYRCIQTEIWYLISEYINPEDVQRFALICRQTAAIVATVKFWSHLYHRFRPLGAVRLRLPEHLDTDAMKHKAGLRGRVIELLFHCYLPFATKAKFGYKLNILIGKQFVTSWHKTCQSIWIMCFKFVDKHAIQKHKVFIETTNNCDSLPLSVANDWESLANGIHKLNSEIFKNDHEGVHLLLIFSQQYMPFPLEMLYGNQESSSGGGFKLTETRQLLSKNLRDINLELDFCDALCHTTRTVAFPSIIKLKVLPWWHPDFRLFIGTAAGGKAAAKFDDL